MALGRLSSSLPANQRDSMLSRCPTSALVVSAAGDTAMTRSKETTTFTYKGFSSLNGTIVPDDVFDVLAPELNEAELRVLLYIVRRTFGFKKDSDNISLRQMVEGITTKDGRVLDRGTGMSKSAVARGLAGLREKKIIVAVRNSSAERGNEATTYRLRFEHDRDDEGNNPMLSIGLEASTPLSRQRDKGVSQQRDKPLSRQRDTQETVEQQTVKQETDGSNIRKAPTLKAREGTMTKSPETIGHRRPPVPGFQGQGRDTALQPRHGRPTAAEAEARRVILAYIGDYAREFNDQAKLKASTTRAFNLYRQAGVALDDFSATLGEARAITQEQTAAIRARVDDGTTAFPRKNKMAYFFAVLEDLLGVREGRADPPEEAPDAVDERPPVRFGQLPRRR